MLSIRPAISADAEPLGALIRSLAHLFYASPDGAGADKFRESIAPQALARLMARPEMIYFVGENDGLLCGAVAIRDRGHLLHLFVAPAFQGRGIGNQLWAAARNAALASGGTGEFTVNASLNTVAVYRRFGFETVGALQQANGLIFQPMKLYRATDEARIDSA